MISTRNQFVMLVILVALLVAWDATWNLNWLKVSAPEVVKTNAEPEIKEEEPLNKPLENPPAVIRAIYYTNASGGSDKKIDYLIGLAKRSEINSVVIDIKDYTGYISYDIALPDAEKYNTKRVVIKDIDGVIHRLHDEGIYVIARMAIFQDPALARARPDLAVKNGGRLWYDNNGLAWIDPASREAWDYNIAIAQEAISRGFDEVNIDYVRFPSDGNLAAMRFPFWDQKVPRREILRQFFAQLRGGLPHSRISVDFFGFVTNRDDDFGVGQVIEDAFEYFDYVSPMVYPSHYPNGFLGLGNPAEHPYAVVKHALDGGMQRLEAFRQAKGDTVVRDVKIRPWLQDFDLGANYDAAKVKAQIKATRDATADDYIGYMIWNAMNNYTEGGLVE